MRGEEMRVYNRFEVRLPVVWGLSGRTEVEGETRNISLGGMFIATATPAPFKTVIELRFRLPALREDTKVEAHVRWVTEEGIGVQFIGLRAIEVWALNQLFKQRPEPTQG